MRMAGAMTQPETTARPWTGRVLVVDDDTAIGAAMRRVLTPFQVTFAQSAAGALGRIRGGARFAAILCDVRMPGMDGMQFHEEVAKLDPPLARRIVYFTAAVGSPELASFLRRTRCACLEKPMDGAALRKALGAAAARA